MPSEYESHKCLVGVPEYLLGYSAQAKANDLMDSVVGFFSPGSLFGFSLQPVFETKLYMSSVPSCWVASPKILGKLCPFLEFLGTARCPS